NPFGASMQTVARIIGGKAGLGVTRQIFYVQLGSFDTHDGQAVQHAKLLTELGAALEYFDNVMTSMGLGNSVTTFTASDFGRTLTSNSDGTDHGWGSHHFVVGGAVQGQDMYGQYPVVGANQANDLGRSVRRHAGSLVWPLRRPGSASLSQLCQLRFEPLSGIYGVGVEVGLPDREGTAILGSAQRRFVLRDLLRWPFILGGARRHDG